ncbi:helix-turn-helix domain-containing protein [Enterobacter sp. A103]|uniref:helix-turn-helix domain-containing protein n=1 Tax=Enterobacter sp. A103 TaxID=3102785 RepID=UPI002ACA3005|nr:helix-turn-helix domain-containing protein [Enterobacter sp. A103]MDZ5641684.1 helix-turn-helix domain-containing protein [Enterobacter sp. A103]
MQPDHSVSVITLGNAIIKHDQAVLLRRKKHQRFSLKKKGHICYLVQGEVAVLRLSDNSQSLVLKGPSVLGLAQMRSLAETHYMRCLSDCEMWSIDADEAMLMMDRELLWKHAFDILVMHLHMYYEREYLDNLPNARTKVLESLKKVWSEEQASGVQHSIYTYTLSRNKLSRSAVHKAIKELEMEGIIQTRRGKLIKLNLQHEKQC